MNSLVENAPLGSSSSSFSSSSSAFIGIFEDEDEEYALVFFTRALNAALLQVLESR